MRFPGPIRYGSAVGSRLGVVADRANDVAPARRRVGRVLLACVVLAVGCAVERTPEIGNDRRETLANIRETSQGGRDITPDDQFGQDPTMSDFGMDDLEGGAECGGSICPFVSSPIEQCCTKGDDVVRGRARTEGRCGMSFDAVDGSRFGTGCWQRDQAGINDTRCADLKSADGQTLELGCCTEQGLCGTQSPASGIGCHYQDGVAPATCAMISEDTECDPLGIFGARITVDVAWGGRSGGLVGLTDDGRDDLVVDLRIEVQSVDGELKFTGLARPCSVVLPPFYSTTLCESYKPIFPDSIWESAKLPAIELKGAYMCLNPGCIMALEPQTTLLGISLENPEAPWPSAGETGALPCFEGTGQACFPDHDADGNPGLTIELQTMGDVPPDLAPTSPECEQQGGYEYWGAPLSAQLAAVAKIVRRSDRIHLGTRTKLGGSGRLSDDCMSSVGTGVAEFVQSRAWGCMVQEGTADAFGVPAGPNDACTGTEAGFMDQNLPIYALLGPGEVPPSTLVLEDNAASSGPHISMVRLGNIGDAVSCEDVRAATYPE
jgi:hypothetical protein